MAALRSLYHILRIWQPPAEFSARLSAVNAETGMRRYNVRSYGHYTIKYPPGTDSGNIICRFPAEMPHSNVCELEPEMLPHTRQYFEELIETGRLKEPDPSSVWYEDRTDLGEDQTGVRLKQHPGRGFEMLQGSAVFQEKFQEDVLIRYLTCSARGTVRGFWLNV